MRPSKQVPVEGRILGIDYGRRRIGIAVSDPSQRIASPVETYRRRSAAQDARYFKELVDKHEAVACIVGIPVHMSGQEGKMAVEARRFGEWLGESTQLPVRFWDERYSSVEADRFLRVGQLSAAKRRARRDMLAAQILLQAYLDRGEAIEGTEPLH